TTRRQRSSTTTQGHTSRQQATPNKCRFRLVVVWRGHSWQNTVPATTSYIRPGSPEVSHSASVISSAPGTPPQHDPGWRRVQEATVTAARPAAGSSPPPPSPPARPAARLHGLGQLVGVDEPVGTRTPLVGWAAVREYILPVSLEG